MFRIEFNLAFKAVIVPIVGSLLNNLFKNNYARSVTSREQWIHLDENMITRILDGEV